MDEVCRARDLRAGDLFETLLTGAAGVRKVRKNAASPGIPADLWYPDGREASVSLHPNIKVRLMERARKLG